MGASYDPSSDHPEDHNLDRLIREERAKHVREHAHDDRARHRFGGGRPSMTPSAVVARVVIVATDTVVAPPPTMRDIFCTEHCAYLCDHAQRKKQPTRVWMEKQMQTRLYLQIQMKGETRRLRSVEYGGQGGPHTDTPWNSRIDHDRLGMPTWNGGRRAIQLIYYRLITLKVDKRTV